MTLLSPQTHVIFPHLVVSNLKEYFPEPEKFLPERWIKRGEIGKIQKLIVFYSRCKCVQIISIQLMSQTVHMLVKKFIHSLAYRSDMEGGCVSDDDLQRMN